MKVLIASRIDPGAIEKLRVDHQVLCIFDATQEGLRAQIADRDVIVVPAAGGGPLAPSAPEPNLSAMMGIDATRPFGEEFAEVPVIPGVEDVPDLLTLARERGSAAAS